MNTRLITSRLVYSRFPTNSRSLWLRMRPKPTGLDLLAHPGFRSSILASLEAVLFLSEETLSLQRLTQILRINSIQHARLLLDDLQRLLKDIDSVYSLEITQQQVRFVTRPDFSAWLNKLVLKQYQSSLTHSMYDVLSILIHRQPTVRAEIDKIRGANSSELLRQLLEIGFVRIVGRQNSLGRPVEYGLTCKCLTFFGVDSVEELLRGHNSSQQL